MTVAVGGPSIGQRLTSWARRGAASKLTTSSAEVRRAALAARKRELEDEHRQRLEDLERQRKESAERLARETAEAARIVESWEDERSRELAANTFAALCKLAAKFPDAPRSTAAEVAKVWRELATTVRTELGEDVNDRLLSAAFTPHELRGAVGHPSFGEGHDGPAVRAGQLSKAIDRNLPAAAIEEKIRALEVTCAARAATLPPNVERARVLTSHASTRRSAMAHERYTRDEAEASRTQGVASAEAVVSKLRAGWHYVAGRGAEQAEDRERHEREKTEQEREIEMVYGPPAPTPRVDGV